MERKKKKALSGCGVDNKLSCEFMIAIKRHRIKI